PIALDSTDTIHIKANGLFTNFSFDKTINLTAVNGAPENVTSLNRLAQILQNSIRQSAMGFAPLANATVSIVPYGDKYCLELVAGGNDPTVVIDFEDSGAADKSGVFHFESFGASPTQPP